MDVRCSLKCHTAPTIVYWYHLLIVVTYDFRKLSQIWVNVCVSNGVSVHSYVHSPQEKVSNHLTYIWYGNGMQFEWLCGFTHCLVAISPLTSPRILASNYPTSGLMFVYMFIHRHQRNVCSTTLHTYPMDVGCSLNGGVASDIAWWNNVPPFLQHLWFQPGLPNLDSGSVVVVVIVWVCNCLFIH